MATLSAAERARIEALIRYIDVGGGGRHINSRVAEDLARIFGNSCGFRCGCPGTFQEGLRDSPVSTLLKVLLCGDEGIVVPGAPGGGEDAIAESPDTVDLQSACGYGVLAGSEITNTGTTNITGDLGLWPGTSVTGAPVVSGDTNINNAAAQQAQLDLTAAYNDAASRTSPTPVIVAGNVGGQTLTPGIYKSTSSLAISSGDLTLDGQGNVNAQWIFQIASTLTTTAGRNVILVGGAQPKNIIWQVGSSATLGTTSLFKGIILALTSITATTGAIIEGALLARNGAVTLDSNSVIAPPC